MEFALTDYRCDPVLKSVVVFREYERGALEFVDIDFFCDAKIVSYKVIKFCNGRMKIIVRGSKKKVLYILSEMV